MGEWFKPEAQLDRLGAVRRNTWLAVRSNRTPRNSDGEIETVHAGGDTVQSGVQLGSRPTDNGDQEARHMAVGTGSFPGAAGPAYLRKMYYEEPRLGGGRWEWIVQNRCGCAWILRTTEQVTFCPIHMQQEPVQLELEFERKADASATVR